MPATLLTFLCHNLFSFVSLDNNGIRSVTWISDFSNAINFEVLIDEKKRSIKNSLIKIHETEKNGIYLSIIDRRMKLLKMRTMNMDCWERERKREEL